MGIPTGKKDSHTHGKPDPHAPDGQTVSCCEVKVGMKRKTDDSHDSSDHIVVESLQKVTKGTAAKLSKRTIQRQ